MFSGLPGSGVCFLQQKMEKTVSNKHEKVKTERREGIGSTNVFQGGSIE